MATDLSTADVEFLAFFSRSPDGVAPASALTARYGGKAAYERINRLRAAGYIEPFDSGLRAQAYALTTKGKDLLEDKRLAEKYVSDKHTQDDARRELDKSESVKHDAENRRYNRKTQIITVVISSALTLLVEHCDDVFVWVGSAFAAFKDWLVSLFH